MQERGGDEPWERAPGIHLEIVDALDGGEPEPDAARSDEDFDLRAALGDERDERQKQDHLGGLLAQPDPADTVEEVVEELAVEVEAEHVVLPDAQDPGQGDREDAGEKSEPVENEAGRAQAIDAAELGEDGEPHQPGDQAQRQDPRAQALDVIAHDAVGDDQRVAHADSEFHGELR